jgi:predicted nuclease of restriction endonuclease-like (RecB) superfamily
MTTALDKSYLQFINELKDQIKTARVKAHLAVNRELVLLYFRIGQSILKKQEEEGWRSKVIDRISQDLRSEFSEMRGLSVTNLDYMRRFAAFLISQQPAGELESLPFFQIPWGHNLVLLDQVSEEKHRLWYASQTIGNAWSRNVLTHQIKSNLHSRQTTLNKTHNFDLTLPNPQSDLATDLLKDEYNFEFLRGSDFKEKELEDHLTENIVKFLLELGKGFAFIGRQYNVQVGGQDPFIDFDRVYAKN